MAAGEPSWLRESDPRVQSWLPGSDLGVLWLQDSHPGTLWTQKSMLPSRREHRFQKFTVSAYYLHLGLKITSQTDFQDASMALKTNPERIMSLPRRTWNRFLVVSGTILGAPRLFWSDQGPPKSDPWVPCGSGRATLHRFLDPMHLREILDSMNVSGMWPPKN